MYAITSVLHLKYYYFDYHLQSKHNNMQSSVRNVGGIFEDFLSTKIIIRICIYRKCPYK
jgi:hypothetical protein